MVNRKLVSSIMTELGLLGLRTLKTGKRNLVNDATSEDLVNRNFIAQRPNQIWLTDITEHPTPDKASSTAVSCWMLLQRWP